MPRTLGKKVKTADEVVRLESKLPQETKVYALATHAVVSDPTNNEPSHDWFNPYAEIFEDNPFVALQGNNFAREIPIADLLLSKVVEAVVFNLVLQDRRSSD